MQPQIAHALTSRHKSSDVQQLVLAQLDCWKRDRLHLGREAGRAALLAVKAPAAERRPATSSARLAAALHASTLFLGRQRVPQPAQFFITANIIDIIRIPAWFQDFRILHA